MFFITFLIYFQFYDNKIFFSNSIWQDLNDENLWGPVRKIKEIIKDCELILKKE